MSGGEVLHIVSGHDDATTNNRMEIMAAIAGIETLLAPARVTLYSDSALLINTMAGGWKRKKNLDLSARMDAAAKRHAITWQWVRSHAGNVWNEAADELCGAEALNYFTGHQASAANYFGRAGCSGQSANGL